MNAPTEKFQASKDVFFANLVQALLNDERFVAAWLTGSYARGNADALSDFDLTVVVSNEYCASLCQRLEQVSAQTSPERLELFSQFGTPAILHENNNNAPDGGTFTFILYTHSAFMVDWTLVPQEKAARPAQAHRLFNKVVIPDAPSPEPESLEYRVKRASEIVAFFWMMLAVTAKYLNRQDHVFVTRWLEELSGMQREVERLVAGKPWEYHPGSLSPFEPTGEGQRQALMRLGEQMEEVILKLARLGGDVRPSPMPEIRYLLSLG